MSKILMSAGVAVLGTLIATSAIATDTSANVSANIIYKIGSKTYNGTTSGVLNINSEPAPEPTPTPVTSANFIITGISDTAAALTLLNSKASDWSPAISGNNITVNCPSGFVPITGNSQNIYSLNSQALITYLASTPLPNKALVLFTSITDAYSQQTSADAAYYGTQFGAANIICVENAADWSDR